MHDVIHGVIRERLEWKVLEVIEKRPHPGSRPHTPDRCRKHRPMLMLNAAQGPGGRAPTEQIPKG